MSTTSESQPIWAMTSADQLEGIPHQLLMTAFPSAQISRIRFARAIRSSIAPYFIGPIPPASGVEVKRRAGLVRGEGGVGGGSALRSLALGKRGTDLLRQILVTERLADNPVLADPGECGAIGKACNEERR